MIIGNLLKKWIPLLIGIVTALLVLVGYLVPTPPWVAIRDMLIQWAVIVTAFAFFLGLLNVIRVHVRRTVRRRRGWLNSLVLILALMVTLILTVLEIGGQVPPFLPAQPSGWIFNYIIRPVGASLAGLVVFALLMAAFRIFQVRRGLRAFVFIVIVILTLVTTTPPTALTGQLPLALPFAAVRRWLVDVIGMAGIRGLLIGVALGTVITTLRMLTTDRPHSEF